MGDPCQYTCMAELSQTLITIIITQLVIGNTQELLIPKIVEWFNARKAAQHNASGTNKASKDISPIEHDINKEEYDMMMGTLLDYSELSIRYGFITLFVCSW